MELTKDDKIIGDSDLLELHSFADALPILAHSFSYEEFRKNIRCQRHCFQTDSEAFVRVFPIELKVLNYFYQFDFLRYVYYVLGSL